MVFVPKQLIILATSVFLCASSFADEYVVDVPQLVGTHGAGPYTVADVELQLPTSFGQIDSGSLRLTGEHFPGLTGNFFGGGGPIGAALLLEDHSPDDPPFTPYPYADYRMAHDLQEFSLEIPIRVAYQAVPDFKQWLNGTAEFRFSVGPPIINAASWYAVYPLVRIDRAELVLTGEPIGVPEPGTILLGVLGGILLSAYFRVRWACGMPWAVLRRGRVF